MIKKTLYIQDVSWFMKEMESGRMTGVPYLYPDKMPVLTDSGFNILMNDILSNHLSPTVILSRFFEGDRGQYVILKHGPRIRALFEFYSGERFFKGKKIEDLSKEQVHHILNYRMFTETIEGDLSCALGTLAYNGVHLTRASEEGIWHRY